MIGLWWLTHIQDVLAAASDHQLELIRQYSSAEQAKRAGMNKTGIKCRQKRATERVAKQLIRGRLEGGPKDERAS